MTDALYASESGAACLPDHTKCHQRIMQAGAELNLDVFKGKIVAVKEVAKDEQDFRT